MRVNDLRGGYKKKKFLWNNNSSLIITNDKLAKKSSNYFDKLLNCVELTIEKIKLQIKITILLGMMTFNQNLQKIGEKKWLKKTAEDPIWNGKTC